MDASLRHRSIAQAEKVKSQAERGSMTCTIWTQSWVAMKWQKGGIRVNSTHRVFPLGADVSADFVHMLPSQQKY